MRLTHRSWGAALTLAVAGVPAFAQAPPPPPPPAPAKPLSPATPTAPAKAPPPAPAAMITVSPTAVAATVNGQPLYEVAVQRALVGVPPEKVAPYRLEVINHLANNMLIEQHLKKTIEVPKADVDKRVGEMRDELKKAGEDLDKMLAKFKLAEPELREHIAADLRWHKYASGQATDKALGELFAANKDLFDGTTVRARHILITPAGDDAKSQAAAVAQLQALKKQVEGEVAAGLAKLPKTADKVAQDKARFTLANDAFAALAKAKSDCSTKADGGSVGPFLKSGAPFANAAFALRPGEMSDVVKTPFGYHLILVTERVPGKETKFEDKKELVKEVFFDRLQERLAAEVRAKSKVVVHPAPR